LIFSQKMSIMLQNYSVEKYEYRWNDFDDDFDLIQLFILNKNVKIKYTKCRYINSASSLN